MKTENFNSNRNIDNTWRKEMEINRSDNESSQYESRYRCDTKYQCLLKCEEDKIYHQPGNCPDCNMKLISVDESHNRR